MGFCFTRIPSSSERAHPQVESALSHADANAYRVHHLLAFVQVTRTQQLPTKNHTSAELPGEKNYWFDPTWTSLPKARPTEDHLGSKKTYPELPKNGLGRPSEQERCQSRWKGRGTVFA